MVEGLRAPEKNRHGLVLPPDPAKITPARRAYYQKKTISDRHHLYFPKYVFQETGELSVAFREHRFNSIWLPRFQHEKLHRRYSSLVEKHPKYFLPSEEVMKTFLDEARLLDEMDICVKAIHMIDSALYEGRVKNTDVVLEHREDRLATIREVANLVPRLEIITPVIAGFALQSAQYVLEDATPGVI